MNKPSLIQDNFVSKQEIEVSLAFANEKRVGLVCPNCGTELVPLKCKLRCEKRGCGYLVTCSEW